MDITSQHTKIITAINAAADLIFSISHQIHAQPEIAYQEFFASGLLADALESFGFQVERGITGIPTAFRASKGNPDGPRVAFLAEYDALPELGHACGHNIIAASALSAGIGLGAIVDDLPGQVLVIGTPAEETSGAKVEMVKLGIFNDVDAALMIHPFAGNYTLTEALALDAIQVEYFGAPAHAAAAPWDGKNALDALVLLFTSLNALRQQIKPDARIHGIITHGGVAPNIIPEYTAGRFYLRAHTRTYLNELVEKFQVCVQAAAAASGTRAETSHFESSFDDMANNVTLAQRMTDYMSQSLGAGSFGTKPDSGGSSDMGDVSHVVPGINVNIDITNGQKFFPHTHEFCLAAASAYADQAMLRAGKGLALTGYDFLHDPEFRLAARAEFVASLGYQPPRQA